MRLKTSKLRICANRASLFISYLRSISPHQRITNRAKYERQSERQKIGNRRRHQKNQQGNACAYRRAPHAVPRTTVIVCWLRAFAAHAYFRAHAARMRCTPRTRESITRSTRTLARCAVCCTYAAHARTHCALRMHHTARTLRVHLRIVYHGYRILHKISLSMLLSSKGNRCKNEKKKKKTGIYAQARAQRMRASTFENNNHQEVIITHQS